MTHNIPFENLSESDLVVDAIYDGGSQGNMGAEPIHKILPGISNQSGFRVRKLKNGSRALVVLFSSLDDDDWPDSIDTTLGILTYFGDNKKPGKALHDTSKGGNKLLSEYFNIIHNDEVANHQIPPFLIFTKFPTAKSKRSVQFKGVAVPGHPSLTSTQALIAIWKTTDGQRFQNYRSTFSILNIPVVSREWIKDILDGNHNSDNAPQAWKAWTEKSIYKVLTSEPTTNIRSIDDQMPDTKTKSKIVDLVYNQFKANPHDFEDFAAKIFAMDDDRVIIDEITKRSRDGGRAAIGRYRLGMKKDPVYVEFALEAKCYKPGGSSVNVKDTSRLISRIRNRQFGVVVTTSVIGKQPLKEIRLDKHPIIFITGKDIAEILISHGYSTIKSVKLLLNSFEAQ